MRIKSFSRLAPRITLAVATALGLAALTLPAPSARAQGGAGDAPGQWLHNGGDRAASKYSPLDQINRDNVGDLEIAWRWETADAALKGTVRGLPGQLKTTPLMIDGTLYATTAFSQLAAIDAGTGVTKWVYDPKSYEAGRPTNTGFQHRGAEYWRGEDGEERIIYATGARQLISIDIATGKPDPNFGTDGIVDLEQDLGRKFNPRYIAHNSPPIVCRDSIVVGSIIFDAPPGNSMPPGHVRAYDVRTGKFKWRFNTIPQEGEIGNETWENDAWKKLGNTNVWTMMSADEELGYVYLPTSTPTNDWYGGHRLGDNLFAESIVCVDAETGERVWHFQAVHHGLWDYDFPAAPNLVDIVVDGKPIKALAQVSKQGFCYVFDRATGEPVWPIEERPVPESVVPGERTAPTQPFPTKPPPFERQGFTEDDVIDFTPEIKAEAMRILENYVMGPIFTPPWLIGHEGKQGTIMLPSAAGGANWGGASFDPETGILYVPSMTLPMLSGVAQPRNPERTDFKYMRQGGFLPEMPFGLPIVKPPYGRITAMDLNKGEIVWQVPHGEGPRNHPMLKDMNLGPLGATANGVFSNGGGVLTKNLLFAIQAEQDDTSIMRMGPTGYLRAWDKTTGEQVWEHDIDLTPHGTPMTYLHDGRQYVVFAAGGLGQNSELIAFALPRS